MSKRGFASLSPERRKEIASNGGKKAHENGTAHKWTQETAKAAGHKGGVTTSQNRDHMAAIGKIGGQNRAKNMLAALTDASKDLDINITEPK